MGLILLDNAPGGGFSNKKIGNGGGMGVGTTAPSGGSVTPPTPPVQGYPYWRVYTTSTSGGYLSISQIEMRGVSSGSNLMTGGTGSASSTQGGYPTSNALDGDINTFWLAAGSTPPHWYGYQFTSSVDIVEVVIRTRNDGFYGNETANNLSFQRSDDGVTWTEEWSETGITGWAQGQTKTFTRPVVGGEARITAVGVEIMSNAAVTNPIARVTEVGVEVMATVF